MAALSSFPSTPPQVQVGGEPGPRPPPPALPVINPNPLPSASYSQPIFLGSNDSMPMITSGSGIGPDSRYRDYTPPPPSESENDLSDVMRFYQPPSFAGPPILPLTPALTPPPQVQVGGEPGPRPPPPAPPPDFGENLADDMTRFYGPSTTSGLYGSNPVYTGMFNPSQLNTIYQSYPGYATSLLPPPLPPPEPIRTSPGGIEVLYEAFNPDGSLASRTIRTPDGQVIVEEGARPRPTLPPEIEVGFTPQPMPPPPPPAPMFPTFNPNIGGRVFTPEPYEPEPEGNAFFTL
jgi:hypothetical protein